MASKARTRPMSDLELKMGSPRRIVARLVAMFHQQPFASQPASELNKDGGLMSSTSRRTSLGPAIRRLAPGAYARACSVIMAPAEAAPDGS